MVANISVFITVLHRFNLLLPVLDTVAQIETTSSDK